jgi:hypothetical protein
MTVQAALCQIKLQGTHSSAIKQCMAVLEWLFINAYLLI